MSRNLKTMHPMLMVTEVVTASVVIYHNASSDRRPINGSLSEAIRLAIIESLPRGDGVGPVQVVFHGQYEPEHHASAA